MSIYKSQIKNKQISEAILDEVSYFAVFGIKLTAQQIYNFLSVKTSFVATKQQLNKLVANKKLRLVGDEYSIVDYKYTRLNSTYQDRLLKRAKRLSYLLRIMPWIKSIVVINSVSYGNCNSSSDIDLLFVSSTHRMYIAKGIVYYLLKTLGLKESANSRAGKFSTGWWITTKGAVIEKDFGETVEPHVSRWVLMAKPVYGENFWQQALASSEYLKKRFPNHNFMRPKLPVETPYINFLDKIDSLGYRMHLRHVSRQAKYHLPNAFLRIRPDIIVQCHATLDEINSKYENIRNKFVSTVAK